MSWRTGMLHIDQQAHDLMAQHLRGIGTLHQRRLQPWTTRHFKDEC